MNIQSIQRASSRVRTALPLLAAAAMGTMLAMPQSAQALPANPGLSAPQVTENVACRVVRSQVIGPRGRVTYRTRSVCTPNFVRPRGGCTTERQRVVRPNGSVVFKTIRRCR